MKKAARFRPKAYNCLKDNDHYYEKAKGTKRYVVKRKIKFQDYKTCLKASQIINKLNIYKRKELMLIILKKIYLAVNDMFFFFFFLEINKVS